MKWETPKVYWPWERQPGMPDEGAKRYSTVFALWPVECTDGVTRWLERVRKVETFGRVYYGIRGCFSWGWKPVYESLLVHKWGCEHNPSYGGSNHRCECK
jgi:hypothetical protein